MNLHQRLKRVRVYRSYFFLLIAITTAVFASASVPARAQAPADLAAITIKGVTFHLPASGKDADDIEIRPLPADLKQRLSVADVVRAPAETQRRISEWDLVGVTLPTLPNLRPGLFLGRFVRDSALPYSFDASVGTNATDRCTADEQYLKGYRVRARAGENVAPDGWAEFMAPGRLQQWTYIRSSNLLGNQALPKNIDTFVCDYFGYCRATFCLASIRFGYNFYGTDRFRPDVYTPKTPRGAWPQIVQNAADVVRTILGDELWNAESGR